jgi:hypothetical protein
MKNGRQRRSAATDLKALANHGVSKRHEVFCFFFNDVKKKAFGTFAKST